MSCFVVPAFHIDALVSWAVDRGAHAFFDGLDPRGLAAELWIANCTAYCCRYGEVVGEDYTFSKVNARGLDSVAVLKACDCLEYQCSDWPEWPGSVGHRALARIRRRAIEMLPGYDRAAWTLEEVTA